MESTFKFLFFIGILLFAIISVGIFLLIIRVSLMFNPVIHFMGLSMSAL